MINMSHFGQLTEANACIKNILACFHGGILWLDSPITVTVAIILEIMRIPKDGCEPSQYFRGKYNDKRLATKLKKCYDLHCDRWAYRIDNINDQVMRIGAMILARKVVKKNRTIQCNLGIIACA